MRGLIADLLDAGRIDSGTLSISPERCAVTDLVERARSAFRTAVRARRARRGDLGRRRRRGADARASGAALRQARRRGSRNGGLRPGAFHLQGPGGGARRAHPRGESDGPGRGRTITFTLPAAESGDAAPAAVPSRAPDGRTRILALDDDPNALRFVRDALTGAGYEAIVTGEPGDLPGLIADKRPSLVLLDLLLPDNDGLELFQSIPELSDLPVIFISAYGRDETVARAFEFGADDYIVKPFSPTELLARIGAALRRRREPSPFVHGDLAIHYESREVTVRGEAVDLTATEFELLRELSLNAGRVVPHETLLERVWEGRENADANLLRIFVRNVRRKLGDSARNPTWIFTLRRVGYRMPRPPRG